MSNESNTTFNLKCISEKKVVDNEDISDEELKQLKIDCVKAGLLTRRKEKEAWDCYSKMTKIEFCESDKKIKLLEKQIDDLKLKSFNNYAQQEKIRHKKIKPFFEKWHNLSFKLKFYGIKIDGRKEKLEKMLVELRK